MLTREQADAGMEYLKELRARNNYWGAMWVPEAERLVREGKPLEEVMTGCLHIAAKWFSQAGAKGSGMHGGAYPTGVDGPLGDSLWGFAVVMGQQWEMPGYGYGAAR